MNEYFSKMIPDEQCDQVEEILTDSQAGTDSGDLASLQPHVLQGIDKIGKELIVVCDEWGTIQFVSKNVTQILGYRVTDIIGTFWIEMVKREDAAYIQKNKGQILNQGQEFNLHLRNQHGKYIWFDCTLIRVESEKGGGAHYLAVLQDITNKKEAEEMMIRSEKMSIAGQLAAGVAHEIRNPLTSMKGFLQLLQAGVARKEAYYNILFDEIDKIETITSELLFISKPLADNKQAESIDQMVNEVVVLLRPQASLNNIEIIWERKSSHTVYCDRSQIKQILINLIKNAIEAMNEPGVIEITYETHRSGITLSIIDEGPGIPEDIIHKLGEPFFTTKQNGTGLGLMITKQILKHHNGKLEVFRNKEKGSTFQIQLPAKD